MSRLLLVFCLASKGGPYISHQFRPPHKTCFPLHAHTCLYDVCVCLFVGYICGRTCYRFSSLRAPPPRQKGFSLLSPFLELFAIFAYPVNTNSDRWGVLLALLVVGVALNSSMRANSLCSVLRVSTSWTIDFLSFCARQLIYFLHNRSLPDQSNQIYKLVHAKCCNHGKYILKYQLCVHTWFNVFLRIFIFVCTWIFRTSAKTTS